MHKLYAAKGGKDEEFNCNSVSLESEDLNQLEADAIAKTLTPTEGFFFGPSNPFSDDNRDEILEFIKVARRAIAKGLVVVYYSWW